MLVSICTVRLRRDARILDLAVERDFNPFTSGNPKYESEFIELMRGFADEMSRPQQREDDLTHYTPCQKLCDQLADAGIEGIRYLSALYDNGTNVLLFDPTIAEVQGSHLVEIRAVSVEFDELD